MADERSSITVAVESAIHDALADVMQRICDQHKIQVESVRVQWIETVDVHEFRNKVRRLDVRTVKTY